MTIDAVQIRHKIALQGMCPLTGFRKNLAEFGLRYALPHGTGSIHIGNAQENTTGLHIQRKLRQAARMPQHNAIEIIVELTALVKADLLHLQGGNQIGLFNLPIVLEDFYRLFPVHFHLDYGQVFRNDFPHAFFDVAHNRFVNAAAKVTQFTEYPLVGTELRHYFCRWIHLMNSRKQHKHHRPAINAPAPPAVQFNKGNIRCIINLTL